MNFRAHRKRTEPSQTEQRVLAAIGRCACTSAEVAQMTGLPIRYTCQYITTLHKRGFVVKLDRIMVHGQPRHLWELATTQRPTFVPRAVQMVPPPEVVPETVVLIGHLEYISMWRGHDPLPGFENRPGMGSGLCAETTIQR